MKSVKLPLFILILLTALSISLLNAHAATPVVQTELLNHQAGSPKDPKNIKVKITLPESYSKTGFSASDFNIYIYPQALDIATGRRSQYKADKVLLWQYNNQIFLDIRKPPKQRSGGGYTLYLETVKNKHTLFTTELADKIIYEHDEVDVVLIIDSSLSMHNTDPYRQRLRAAKAFADLARSDSNIKNIGIIAFNNESETIAELTPVRNSKRLHDAIDSINTSGQTDIGKALESGLNMLSDASSKRTAAVLLTDGRNESSVYQDQHRLFKQYNIPVYCIGLSDQADTRLLKQIATETGATYFKAADDNDLLGIYQRIASVISRREVIFNKKIPYSKNKISIPIDNSINEVSFMLNAGMNEVIFNLISPDGEKFEVIPSKSTNFSEIRITKPEPGLWTAVFGNRASKKDIELNITADTSLYLDSFPPLQTDKNIWLSSTLADDGDTINNSNIFVLSNRGRLKLFDDGMHNDGEASDGVYTCQIPLDNDFDLDLLLRAWGSNKLPYIRQKDAGTIKRNITITEEPEVHYELSAKSDLAFPASYAGTTATAEVNIEYNGLAGELDYSFSPLNNSIYSIKPEAAELTGKSVKNGLSIITARIDIPTDIPSGKYDGHIRMKTPESELVLPVSIDIKSPELLISNNHINIGSIKNGQTHDYTLKLQLNAGESRPISITNSNPDFDIHIDDSQIISPDTQTTLKLSLKCQSNSMTRSSDTNHLIIHAGDLKESVTLDYTIIPLGEKRDTLVFAHEMSLPEVSRQLTATSMNHEMSLPAPVIQRLTDNPLKQDHQLPDIISDTPSPIVTVIPKATQDQTHPVISADSSQEDFLLIIFVITATLALSVILLIIRKLTSRRMVRFALLSATLHLPIIAVIASYIIVTNNNNSLQPQKTIAKMVISTSSEGSNYISQNSSKLRDLNTISSADLPEDNSELTAALPELTSFENSPEDDALDDLLKDTEQLKSSDTSLSIDEFKPSASLSETDIDFDFDELNSIQPIRNESTESSTLDTDLQTELNSLVKPDLPMEEIFHNDSITDATPPNTRTITNNTAELADSEINSITIDEEIENILNSSDTEASMPLRTSTLALSNPESKASLDNLDLPDLSESDSLSSDLIASTDLSRSLDTEIDQTTQLKSLTQTTPLAENPELLLTSIDKTAPLHTDTDYELAIPANDIPDEVTAFDDITINSETVIDDIITETRPRPTLSTDIISESRESASSEPIPGITADGLCLDFESINESIDRRTSQQSFNDTAISSISNSLPEIDELAIDNDLNDELIPPLPINEIPLHEDELPGRLNDLELTDIDNIDTLSIDDCPSNNSIISSIDQLDINIEKKLDRLTTHDKTLFSTNPNISRMDSSQSDAQIAAAPVIPLKPDLQKLSSKEHPVTTDSIDTIAELPASTVDNFDLDAAAHSDSSLIDEELAISQIAVKAEEPVKITDNPKRLNSSLSTGTDLIRVPQNLQPNESLNSDSTIEAVSLNIGILSEDLLSSLNNNQDNSKISFSDLSNSTDLETDLLSCQLLISDRSDFSSNEIELIKDYISSGGYLWVYNNGIPQELTSIGQISALTADDEIFNSNYKIGKQSILFAEAISTDSKRRILATGSRNNDSLIPLFSNVFSSIFGNITPESLPDSLGTDETVYNSSYTWQNFSGIDQSRLGWKGPKWGNAVKTTIAPDGQGGDALMVQIDSGREDITNVNYVIPDHEGRRIDLSDNSSIILDVYNASRRYINISLALTTESSDTGWDEFETEKIQLNAGWNRNVVIPIKNLRSRRDPDGGYIHPLNAADNCARVSFYFNNIKTGANLLIDNIRWAE